MEDIVKSVNTHIVFHFRNGDHYELPLKTSDDNQSLDTFCRSVKLVERLCTNSSSNIIGNIAGNTLNIEITSYDKLLIPTNEDSEYYGYMNDTAYVDINCDIMDDIVDGKPYKVYMGRYIVSTWEGGNTSSNSSEVSISCVDILSKIKNITINKLRLKRNISFNEYIKVIVDKLNSTLPSYMQIIYNDNEVNIWKNSNYTWQMYFNNIDRDNIENIFNCIAKYTISYIWIDRDRHIRADHLLDDKAHESVGVLSGSSNLLSYGTQTGDIGKYSGVKVSYIQSVSTNDKQLLQLKNIQLYQGENIFNEQRMNSDNVYDIHTIEVKCDKGKGVITSFLNYKDSLDFTIEADYKTKAEINVYGITEEENYAVIEKYKDNNIKDGVIEIKNRVLLGALIPAYVDGLLKIMSMKDNQVYVEGFINPRINIGDLVEFIGNNMNISGYYKITGLEYTLGTNYRCKATMIKVIETHRSVEDILYIHNELLLTAISGDIVGGNLYPDISKKENDICGYELMEQLENLTRVTYSR